MGQTLRAAWPAAIAVALILGGCHGTGSPDSSAAAATTNFGVAAGSAGSPAATPSASGTVTPVSYPSGGSGSSTPTTGSSSGSSGATPSSGTTMDPLALSGSPATAVAVGRIYSFQPTLTAASGATVGFSVQNLPAWASFSTVTGQLQGTPGSADVGVYPDIVISANDGAALASIQAFAITVQSSAAANGPGTATLSWVAPSTNSDGSPMTDLAGFRIYYGTSSNSLDNVIDVVADGNATGFVVSGLAPGTYYFRVSALDSSGVESSESNEISRSVG